MSFQLTYESGRYAAQLQYDTVILLQCRENRAVGPGRSIWCEYDYASDY